MLKLITAVLIVVVGCYGSLARLPINRIVGYTARVNCWTCPPGWSHWWDFGLTTPSNGDQCQCMRGIPSTTTKAPTTTTKAPSGTTTTSKPTPNCWTCPAGYVHWYDIAGMAQPTDQCACVQPSSGTPTTKSPTTTTTRSPSPVTTTQPTPYCWTCPSGMSHWYELGLPQPTDQCACYPNNTPTTTTTSTTTKAPSATTSKPVTTIKPTPYCWTCPPNMLHWYELGLAQPTDQCACYPISASTTAPSGSTTTKAPTSGPTTTTSRPTPYCWTCPAGYVHWYDIGMSSPPGGDQCACVIGSAPSTTSTSSPGVNPGQTSAPTSAPTSLMQRFVNAMTPSSTSPGSVSFSACVAPYSPWNPPPAALTKQLLSQLVAQTNYRTIMVYSLDQYIAQYAEAVGVKVLGIIYLSGDWTANAAAIASGVQAANQYPNTVIAVSCGNEAGANLGATSSTAAIINNCVTQVRQQGVKQPVGCIDTPASWIQSNGAPWTAVSQNLDWMGVNAYPWFDNMYGAPPITCATASNVGIKTIQSYQKIENAYPGKPVFLTEGGWPSSSGGGAVSSPPNVNNGQVCTTASDSDQRTGAQSLVNAFRQYQKPCNLFSSYREAWKGSSATSVEAFWGVCSGTSPFACYNAPS